MFYFCFPSRRLHVQYKTLPVSYKVLDLKWAVYHKMLVGTRKGGGSKETALEKCASHKTAQSYQGKWLNVTFERIGGGVNVNLFKRTCWHL